MYRNPKLPDRKQIQFILLLYEKQDLLFFRINIYISSLEFHLPLEIQIFPKTNYQQLFLFTYNTFQMSLYQFKAFSSWYNLFLNEINTIITRALGYDFYFHITGITNATNFIK